MKIRDVMTEHPVSCAGDDPLSEAVRVMYEQNCGLVPIVDADREVLLGVVTDRDVSVAAWTHSRPLHEIPVREVMSGEVHACDLHQPLEAVHELMRRRGVFRILVTQADGRLVGVISLMDLARAAAREADRGLKLEVAETLARVHRLQELRAAVG